MDIEKIRQLIELVQQSGINELEISEGDESVCIRRNTPVATTMSPVITATSGAPALTTAHTMPASDVGQLANDIKGYQVRSPMVGMFYRRPNPNDKPFVEIGQKVKVGDPLCIVEAMKMMNRIEADQAGVVTAIHIEDGCPVEFDEPLIVINPQEG
ncbi:MAG: acetyl-CoA carboxylase biotin carboxyl carrier protein [Candidatus Symbiodolus clandestinus]